MPDAHDGVEPKKLFAQGAPTPRRMAFAKTASTLARMRAQSAGSKPRASQNLASCYADLCAADESAMQDVSMRAAASVPIQRTRFLDAAGGAPAPG